MRIAPTHILLDRILSQATWAALRSDEAIKARHRPPRDPARRASLSAGGIFSPLHQATGLCRFSQLFYGFCNAPSLFSTSAVTPV
jgi:hypothetical protein